MLISKCFREGARREAMPYANGDDKRECSREGKSLCQWPLRRRPRSSTSGPNEQRLEVMVLGEHIASQGRKDRGKSRGNFASVVRSRRGNRSQMWR